MNNKILWSSNYGLMDSEESDVAWGLSVTAFDDKTVHVDVAQPGADVHKEFTSAESAYDWLIDFVGGQYLELSTGDFDFRETVYLEDWR